tara:strand:- start:15066 stop:15467 length:402 start_codon:yes stop_codon:yes gene_type:complete
MSKDISTKLRPETKPHNPLPLIYSCSGCSNIAQLANQVAVDFDRESLAEMSCIAGVGGGVKKLVKLAQSKRTIIALDGCNLHCVKHSLATQHVKADYHFTLTDFGIKKRYRENCQAEELKNIKEKIIQTLQLS